MNSPQRIQADIDAISRIPIVGTLLEVVCRSTGLRFAAIARVTDERWVACAVRDQIQFGLEPGGELKLETTLCHEVRDRQQAIIIDHAAIDESFSCHPTPAMYGFQSYISVPIIRKDGSFFGTLCALDPKPVRLKDTEVVEMFRLFADLISFHLGAVDQIDIAESRLQKELALSDLRNQFNRDLAIANKKLQETNRELARVIADKIRLENTLLESQQRLQTILDTMAEGVGIIDLHGRLVYANKMAQEILGITENEIKDRTYFDPRWKNIQLDGKPLADCDHPMAITLSTELPVYDMEIGIEGTGRDRFYISINAAPIFDENGILTGGVGTFMDVTNRRKLMQQKDEFISVASHELKTPLTSLQVSLQLLDQMKGNPSPAMLTKLITQSNKSLGRLNALVNDLLDVNRITQGQLQLRKSLFTVSSMIDYCSQHIRLSDRYRILAEGDLELEIFADEQQIDQVLVNLINNAVKYAPESPVIIIRIEKHDSHAKISVIDKGPGITPEKLPYVFDQYYRADHSGIQFSGLGLGLYISAGIVKKHGGEIGAESQYGQGSTFYFTLPL